ncbi:MAG: ABC transporter ATP-binding protein [Spirochaetota bacterium]
MIEAFGLSRRYDGLLAVDRVSFSVDRSEVVGLLGPNGAGKTTIMKILTGYHFAHEGRALIDGHDIVGDPISAKRSIGYLPENAPLYPELTVSEYLEFIVGMRGVPGRVVQSAQERVIELCELESELAKPIAELSRGFRQRLGIAQALVHDPQVVILDEPSSGLDPNQIQSVRRIVQELGKERTVLLSTHILREAEAVCDRVLILDQGRIVAQGSPAEIGAQTHGAEVFEISLDAQPGSGALRELEELARVIDRRSESSGIVMRVSLEADAASDDLFDWAVRSGLRLRSLVPERDALEAVFARLTTGGE